MTNIQFTTIEQINSSIDDVTKYILEDEVFGKNEVSIIRKNDKIVFCLPTQTNCKMGCTFCHLKGTTRPSKNLSIEWLGSVVDHLIDIEHLHNRSKDLLISYMGVGEPLMNLTGLLGSIESLYDKYDNIRFGISTILPNVSAITSLTKWSLEHPDIRIKLHLSVHGIFNREEIIHLSVNAYSAIDYIHLFHRHTKNPIEYHYTLVDGVNDSIDELKSFNALISNDGATVKFLTLSEYNGCKKTQLDNELIRSIFKNNIVEFYDPPGRDVGSSCGMFNRDLYND